MWELGCDHELPLVDFILVPHIGPQCIVRQQVESGRKGDADETSAGGRLGIVVEIVPFVDEVVPTVVPAEGASPSSPSESSVSVPPSVRTRSQSGSSESIA